MKIARTALLLITIFTSACQHNTTLRQSADFADTWNKTYSVAILPPEAEIKYIQFDSDDKRMTEDEVKAVNVINSELPKLLVEKHYEVRALKFDEYKEAHEEALFQLEKVKQETRKVMDELYKTNLIPEKQAFNIHQSIGSDVNLFADLAKSDLIMYIDYKGYEKSDAMATKDIAATVLLATLTGSVMMTPSQAGQIDAALIDGTTGNILWTNRGLAASPLNKYEADSSTNPLAAPFSGLPDKSGAKPKE